ncbi:hypothetical protein EJ08DRAFT_634771 [Tothia fuscella]|uniref:Uncharacterized protein n=1 Tax=Tothia fuscella TaxID=1048955 RepID=A0A9P4TX27_9PEZI|nr:hypothetical protein EJ08DRAFT_634771 [Tothia fuscella]
MSADRNSPPLPSPNATGRRRSSIAGQFVDLFGARPSNAGGAGSNNLPGPITTAAAQAQQRRLSLTTVGLSGSPNQTSPFGSVRSRGDSISSSNSGTVEESPFEDGDAPTSSVPTTPFARRMSFGARAMQQNMRNPGNGNANVCHANLSLLLVGQGFDFAENLRNRAERSSVTGPSAATAPQSPPLHQRAKSVAVMEPPTQETPKQPRRPDAFQERILKGDFYMD